VPGVSIEGGPEVCVGGGVRGSGVVGGVRGSGVDGNGTVGMRSPPLILFGVIEFDSSAMMIRSTGNLTPGQVLVTTSVAWVVSPSSSDVGSTHFWRTATQPLASSTSCSAGDATARAANAVIASAIGRMPNMRGFDQRIIPGSF
jgi:hypothetical protein